MHVAIPQLAPDTSIRSMTTATSIIVLLITHLFSGWVEAKVDYDANKSKCSHCKKLVDNFKKGLDASKKGNFGGGNTAWEEGALGPWKTSETRFLEITEGEGDREGVCGKDFGCAAFLENHEEAVEEWYYKKQDEIKFFDFLCVQKSKVCCINEFQFGKKCQPCPGMLTDPKKACSGHGKCNGGGDRSGKGTCKCDAGYSGKTCNTCKKGYFNSNTDDATSIVTCTKCHKSCLECTAAGNDQCKGESCTKGYEATEVTKDATTCVDINECESGAATCKDTQYCQNTEGSNSCLACDKSCNGCTGRGDRQCKACATGYELLSDTKRCADIDECKLAETTCEDGTYCKNSPGSHQCETCHRACNGCTGEGPSSCNTCADGFELDAETNNCVVVVAEDESEELGGGNVPHDEL